MKKIVVKIPVGLSPEEEISEIRKGLNIKMLSGTGRCFDKKRIGTQIDIEELNTIIEVKRVGKIISFVTCNMCNSEYQSDCSFPLWVNYGGKTRRIHLCSEICRGNVINACGEGRTAIKKRDLKSISFMSR